nr:zinc finger, CCHC-type [Tanacetum cinerariifolium]
MLRTLKLFQYRVRGCLDEIINICRLSNPTSRTKSLGLRVLWLTRIDQEEVFVVQFSGRSRRVGIDSKGFLEFFSCPVSRQGVEDLRELLHKVKHQKVQWEYCTKHGGSKHVGFKQLGPGFETGVHGVHDEKRVWFEVELQGAQGNRKAKVFQVSKDDTALAQRWLEDKQPEEKTNTDCLVKEQEKEYQAGWKIKIEDTTRVTYLVISSPSSMITFMKPIDMLDDVTSKVVVYMNMSFNESGEYKKTFIGSDVGTGLMQVLHRFEFEVELLEDHTFEVEPQENVDQGAGLQEVQTQDLIDYQLARDRDQHLACELLRYKENSNEAAFEWKAGLKDGMDARSDVYVLSNGCRKCNDNNDDYYWEYAPGMIIHLFLYIDGMVFSYGCKVEIRVTKGLLVKSMGNVLGSEIIRDHSGSTLRVSQSKIYNEKLVQSLLEGHSILSLEGSLSGDCDLEKNGKWSCIYAVESQEYQMVCTRLDIASADVGYELMILGYARSLKANLQHVEALLTSEAGYMAFTEAWKKEIWLKGLLTESRYELRLVAGIATGALVKGCSRFEVPAQVKVNAFQY